MVQQNRQAIPPPLATSLMPELKTFLQYELEGNELGP